MLTPRMIKNSSPRGEDLNPQEWGKSFLFFSFLTSQVSLVSLVMWKHPHSK